MKATDLVRLSLEQSRGWTMALVSDMKDAPLTFPTPRGGNHPLWVLGHLVYSEAAMMAGFVCGQANPLSKWDSLFGRGAKPVADAGVYPAFDELLGAMETTRARTLAILGAMTDEDLDGPSKAPENLKGFFGTVGQVFVMLTHHWTFHAGQVADARRALGRKPLMA